MSNPEEYQYDFDNQVVNVYSWAVHAGNVVSTPSSVQKLRKALHSKAKAEPSFRFYALYDKIYREYILAHAYAQCRSNKGAPGVDGQDFADVEAYTMMRLRRWLAVNS